MAIETEHERWTAREGGSGYIRARLRLLSSDDGGRKTPIASGYRTHWGFPPDVHPDAHDAPLTIESGPGQGLDPGDEALVRLHPVALDLWPPIAPGLRLILLEGSRVIGHAEIIEVVPAVS